MEELLGTSAAATVFGVSARSLARWTSQGLLVPDRVTPQGHHRWSVAGLHRQFEALRGGDEHDG